MAAFGDDVPELTSMVIVYPERGADVLDVSQAVVAAHFRSCGR